MLFDEFLIACQKSTTVRSDFRLYQRTSRSFRYFGLMFRELKISWRASAGLAALALAATSLTVVSPRAGAQSNSTDDPIVIVFDTSGSMGIQLSSGQTRLAAAKSAVSAVAAAVPSARPVGLRSFDGGCGSGILRAPVAANNRASLTEASDGLIASGPTPIEATLRAAINDLPSSLNRTVVLLSDGEESCGGNPCSAVTSLVQAGVSVKINTVGIGTTGTAADQLQCIATVTGGGYFQANTVDGLVKALTTAVVTNACGQDSLAVCYAPEVRFHPEEEYFPMDPSSWLVDGGELKWAADYGCPNRSISTRITAQSLTNGTYETSPVERRGFLQRCYWMEGSKYQTTEFTMPFSRTAPAVTDSGVAIAKPSGVPEDEGFYVNHVGDQPRGDQATNGLISTPVFGEERITNGTGSIGYWFFYGYDPKA